MAYNLNVPFKALRMTIFCREGVRCGALNDIPDRIQKSYLRTIVRAERKRVPKIIFLYSFKRIVPSGSVYVSMFVA